MSRLTARETAERQAKIIELRLTRPDLTWNAIAEKVGTDESTCRRAFRKWKASDQAKLTTVEALEIVHEQLSAMRAVRGRLGALAEQTAIAHCEKCKEACGHTANESILLGSLKSMADMIQKEITLMQSTAILPNDLGLVRVQMDIRHVTDIFIAIFDKYVPAAVRDDAELEIIAALRGQLPSSQEALVSAGGDGGDDDDGF